MSSPKIQAVITSNRIRFKAYNLDYDVRSDHPRFQEISDALNANKLRAAVTAYRNGKKSEVKTGIRRDTDGLTFKGVKLPSVFAVMYSEVMQDGDPDRLSAIEKFFDNVVSNPSTKISFDAFARFLAKTKTVITDRGTFLAYKRLRSNYHDVHSGKFNNAPGIGVISMPRGEVDENQSRECSTGFHQCSYGYLGSFGGSQVIVTEINPRDVVAVPPDYNFTKMRVCSYFPLCDLSEFKELVMKQAQDVLSSMPFFHTHQLQRLAEMNPGRYSKDNLPSDSIPYYYPS